MLRYGPSTADRREQSSNSMTTPSASPRTDGGFRFDTILQPADADVLPTLAGVSPPYLRSVPTTYQAEFLFLRWLQWLLDQEGTTTTIAIIDRYQAADWISQSVHRRLRTYLDVPPDAPTTDPSAAGSMQTHLGSLAYIRRLRTYTTEVTGNGV